MTEAKNRCIKSAIQNISFPLFSFGGGLQENSVMLHEVDIIPKRVHNYVHLSSGAVRLSEAADSDPVKNLSISQYRVNLIEIKHPSRFSHGPKFRHDAKRVSHNNNAIGRINVTLLHK